MGLAKNYIKYIIKSVKKYHIKGPILTLGNQDIYATENDIIRWSKKEGFPYNKSVDVKFSTSQELPRINPQAKKYIHAKTFFELVNIPQEQYYDIDKFDFDQPKILHDLEKPLDTRFNNFFNFVLDSGTLEHIFDVKAVLSNIVNAVKVGGYVLHLVPAANFLNHGFYQFSPTLFFDFYTDNGFDIVESYVVEARGSTYRFYYYDQKRDYMGMFLNPHSRLANCFLVTKKRASWEIVSPSQYYFKILAADAEKVERDFYKSSFDKLVFWARKIIPFRHQGIFFGIWARIKSLISGYKYFDIS